MKSNKKKNLLGAWLLLALLLCVLGACMKSDDYKKYLADGEIIYTGKIDSVRIYSGHDRVLINGLFIADPKVTELRVYWDSRSDSVIVPIVRSAGVDTLNLYVPITEGIHNFELVTYDNDGNKSLSVFRTGTAYGERFVSGLINRPMYSTALDASTGITDIQWGGIDLTTGAFATEILFENSDGEEVLVRDSISVSESKLHGFVGGSSFQYRTLYIPDTLSIDTFYSEYTAITPEVGYFKNLGHPFQRSSWDDGRWGNLANWITTANVRNAGGNTYGGYELRGGVGVLSMEGGWGLPAVNNGKIYQVSTLPAGTHKFEVRTQEAGSAGSESRFFVIALGEELPDIDNVTQEALEYRAIPAGTNQVVTVEITLEEATRIAMGFVATCPDTGTYFKVLGITFTLGGE